MSIILETTLGLFTQDMFLHCFTIHCLNVGFRHWHHSCFFTISGYEHPVFKILIAHFKPKLAHCLFTYTIDIIIIQSW